MQKKETMLVDEFLEKHFGALAFRTSMALFGFGLMNRSGTVGADFSFNYKLVEPGRPSPPDK